jgi:glycerol-3-phosphate acyltransferase PlsX
MTRIAVDAMGGDRAPGAVVQGAVLAARELGVEVALVGQQAPIEAELARHSAKSLIEVISASEVVEMCESPSATLRKKDSSMRVAYDWMKQGKVDGIVSAGNSGAMMAIGMFVLGNLPSVDRPAILAVVPSIGKGTVIIDAGANVECKPRHLIQFAVMGSIYAEQVLGISRPKVGILSNGEEEAKGTELTRAASEQLRAGALNYIGYVEGRDIGTGNVDVVVCDGFVGNVALKTMEGTAFFIMKVLKESFQSGLPSRLGYLLSGRSLRQAYARLDYAEYGGAPLLGLNGVAIIAHGGSGPKAIKNAIRVARDTVAHNVNRHISEDLGKIVESSGEKLPKKVWQQIKSRIENFIEKPEPGEKDRNTKGDRES